MLIIEVDCEAMEAYQIMNRTLFKSKPASGLVKVNTVDILGFAANDPFIHQGCSPCRYDLTSGSIVYNGARYYDPRGGRYITADPRGILLDFSEPSRQVAAQMGIPIQSLNLMEGINQPYGYAKQNPLRYTDPTGEFVLNPITGAVGGFIAGGAGTFAGSFFGTDASFTESASKALTGALFGLASGFVAGFGPAAVPVGIGLDLLLNAASASASEGGMCEK